MDTFKKFRFKLGKITSDSIIHDKKLLNYFLEDSGWLNLPLTSGVKEGQYLGTPQYRKIGNQVFVKGSVTFTPSTSGVTLAILPDGYRPLTEVTFPVLTDSTKLARVSIKNDGSIICHSVMDIVTDKVITASLTYFDLNRSFLID